MSDPLRIFDEAALAKHHARAAKRYAEHDFLLQRAAGDMVERLDLIQRVFESAMIIGPHHQTMRDALRTLSPSDKIQSLQHIPLPDKDAPLNVTPDSQNLLVSLLNLHHVNDVPGLLIQMQRALKPDGLLLATLFGGDTLTELRQAFLHAETEIEGGASPRVAPFASVQDMGSLLQRAGLTLPVVDSDVITVTYDHPLKLLNELRGMGETNILRERRKCFSRRSTFLRMCEFYQDRFGLPNGRIKATFEILTITGWAPDASQQQPLKPGSGDVSLTELFSSHDTSEL